MQLNLLSSSKCCNRFCSELTWFLVFGFVSLHMYMCFQTLLVGELFGICNQYVSLKAISRCFGLELLDLTLARIYSVQCVWEQPIHHMLIRMCVRGCCKSCLLDLLVVAFLLLGCWLLNPILNTVFIYVFIVVYISYRLGINMRILCHRHYKLRFDFGLICVQDLHSRSPERRVNNLLDPSISYLHTHSFKNATLRPFVLFAFNISQYLDVVLLTLYVLLIYSLICFKYACCLLLITLVSQLVIQLVTGIGALRRSIFV